MMFASYAAALSALRAQQFQIEVLGNNLANSSTPGFKRERVTFSELLGQTFSLGSAPVGLLGGTNPVQRGAGVRIGSLDRDLEQGGLEPTGRPLDLALDGEGFFVVDDGNRQLFTRAGSFGLDAEGRVVELRTGYRVASSSGGTLSINLDEIFPPRATGSVGFAGNLSATVTGPTREVLTTRSPFREGTRASILGTVTTPTFPLTHNSSLTIRVDGGAAQTITFLDGPAAFPNGIGNATQAEVVAYMNARLAGARAVADPGGAVRIESDRKGTASSLDIDDGVGSPAGVLGLATSLVSGTEQAAAGTSDLNTLTANAVEYAANDRINITGRDADGRAVSVQFVYGVDGTTLADLVTRINGAFTSATASIDASGNLVLTAGTPGAASLSLSFADEAGGTGSTAWTTHALSVTTEGADADRGTTTIDVVDGSGRTHTVSFTFERDAVDPRTWNLRASIAAGEGTLSDAEVRGIFFNEDGSFGGVSGTGAGDGDIEVTWEGLSTSQTVTLDFGTAGGFGGLTALGGATTAAARAQDGYEAGSLSRLGVRPDGALEAFFTNGRSREVGVVGVALFANPAGLARVGDSLFAVSPNSGEAQLSRGTAGRAGRIVGGALEASNVDVTEQMVRLLETQRAFQASSRTIAAADNLLLEALNLVR